MLAVTGGKVKTVTEGTLEDVAILIEGTKVREIIPVEELSEGCEVIDASGKVITPGLIDVHTHLGLMEEGSHLDDASINESTQPVTPHLRVMDAVNPCDRGFKDAITGGVTCVQILPGSANVIGGQGIVVKTGGEIIDEMVVLNPSGMKVALGENPKRVYKEQKRMPSTRMGIAAVLREALVNARNYLTKKTKALEKGETFEEDIKNEALIAVLEGKVPLRIHAHRADDIMTAIRIAGEFNVDYTIEHCTEGHKVAAYLKQMKVRPAVGPTISSRCKLELKDLGWHTVVTLIKKGLRVAITTDHPVLPVQYLTLSAAMAVRAGLSEEEALKAITIYAAEHLGISERIGSIEAGKDADLVIWDGDPFHYKSCVDTVIIEGKKVYEKGRC